MQKIVEKQKNGRVEDWEVENFKELHVIDGVESHPDYIWLESKKHTYIRTKEDPTVFMSPGASNYVQIKTKETAEVLFEAGWSNLVVMKVVDIPKFKKIVDDVNKLHNELLDEEKRLGIGGYRYYRREYDFGQDYKTNMQTISNIRKEIKEHIKNKKALEEGTDEMKQLEATFEELGKWETEEFTIYESSIEIHKTKTQDKILVLLDTPLQSRQVSSLMHDMGERIKASYLVKFLTDKHFTLIFNKDKFRHWTVGDKFKVKRNKTHTWTINGDMHRDILNLNSIQDSFNLIDFYENSTKAVVEYYNKIEISDMKIKFPCTVTNQKSGECLIAFAGHTIKHRIHLTNRKKDAFNMVKNQNFTVSMEKKSLYRKLLNIYEKKQALEILKNLALLGSI